MKLETGRLRSFKFLTTGLARGLVKINKTYDGVFHRYGVPLKHTVNVLLNLGEYGAEPENVTKRSFTPKTSPPKYRGRRVDPQRHITG